MKAGITSTLQHFRLLPIKQKIIPIVLLGLISSVLVCLSVALVSSFPQKIRQVHSLYDKQKVWLSQSAEIEKILSAFAKSDAGHKKQDLPKVVASIEKIAVETGASYTLTEIEKGHIEKLTIHRYKVSFDGIPLAGIVAFSSQIEALDSSIAISEIQINAQGKLLSAYCIISILDTE
ncbi:MAG: hypothetical protein LBE98_03590 [Puniceicoccales bacterium]|jgi:hypothetical protein|nr:hypothetical protein [Puniceicoccales bacterium]